VYGDNNFYFFDSDRKKPKNVYNSSIKDCSADFTMFSLINSYPAASYLKFSERKSDELTS
jgi:hypothetical protein